MVRTIWRLNQQPKADGQRSQSNDLTLIEATMETQEEVCSRFGVAGRPPSAGEKLGIALATLGRLPINGLRIHVDGTCG